MYFQQKIRQKQSLRLALTPRLKQALQLLALPLIELNSFIKEQAVENPLLEIEKLIKANSEKPEIPAGSVQTDQSRRKATENIAAGSPNLHEHLIRQLSLFSKSSVEKMLGQAIIDNIDKDGYLRISLEEIAKELNAASGDVQKALLLIQSFFPIGVGARNLTECLLLQLKYKGQENSLVAKIIKEHLPDLEKKRFIKIVKSLKISMDDLNNALVKISHLEPKPGRAFINEHIRYVTPDILLSSSKNGYKIELNGEEMLPLYINPYYSKLLRTASTKEETKKYLKEKLAQAVWLIKAIERRQSTIKKVVQYIIKIQKDFLDKGPAFIKPLTLKEVARAIGVNESTVSRSVANKHIHTHYGTFELKRFFSGAIEQEDGQALSIENIKSKIKELIDNENAQKPLNDEAIVKTLKSQGVNIARRTVAKYRKQSKILSASLRKRSIRSKK